MRHESAGDVLAAIGLDHNDTALIAQVSIFIRALEVYEARNKKYNDNWKRMGWRGALIRVRERTERLWDNLWGWPHPVTLPDEDDLDDAYDLINFAAFLIRGAGQGEATRDGEWFGGESTPTPGPTVPPPRAEWIQGPTPAEEAVGRFAQKIVGTLPPTVETPWSIINEYRGRQLNDRVIVEIENRLLNAGFNGTVRMTDDGRGITYEEGPK